MQVEDLGIGDHQSLQELVTYPDLSSNRNIPNLICKEEILPEANSKDSDDVSQFFKCDENVPPTKRRKTALVRREINYDESMTCCDEKERLDDCCIPADQHNYYDSLNGGTALLRKRLIPLNSEYEFTACSDSIECLLSPCSPSDDLEDSKHRLYIRFVHLLSRSMDRQTLIPSMVINAVDGIPIIYTLI